MNDRITRANNPLDAAKECSILDRSAVRRTVPNREEWTTQATGRKMLNEKTLQWRVNRLKAIGGNQFPVDERNTKVPAFVTRWPWPECR